MEPLFLCLLCLSFISTVVSITTTSGISNTDPYTDYVFAYFTGEGSADGETISLAVSHGNNPLNWTELHHGKPVLVSTVGTRGVRDPTIIRAYDESKFWIIATDLKIHGSSGSWDAAGRTGSRSIVIWESDNLRTWTGPRLAQVSPPMAGNTWAPEAIYDPKQEAYMVFWASALYPQSDPAHKRTSYYRIMKSMTKDFKTFSHPEIYIDTGWSVIDSTIVLETQTSKYYRFSKDERAKSPNGKFIFQESSDDLSGPWKSIKDGIGRGVISRGEGPTVFKSNTVPNKWHMFIDEFGGTGRGYVPFETMNISIADWRLSSNYNLPKHPRHGSVIPITSAEKRVLLTL